MGSRAGINRTEESGRFVMTIQGLAQQYKMEEAELKRCALLAGFDQLEEYDEAQQVLISFAVMLARFGLQEDRIRICCTSPGRFPEMIRQEQTECSSKTRREELDGMLACVDDDWSGNLDEIENAVMLLEFQLDTAGGVPYGPHPWMSMLIILGISVAVALLLKPQIQALLERLLLSILK